MKIGGKGRPVIGRIVLDGTPEVPVDWTQNEPVAIRRSRSGTDRALGPLRHRGSRSNIDKDGRFRIEDVPAGRYELRGQRQSGRRSPGLGVPAGSRSARLR